MVLTPKTVGLTPKTEGFGGISRYTPKSPLESPRHDETKVGVRVHRAALQQRLDPRLRTGVGLGFRVYEVAGLAFRV